jgi:hypothetical protein
MDELKRKHLEILLKIATAPLIDDWISYNDELKKKTGVRKIFSPDYPFIYFLFAFIISVAYFFFIFIDTKGINVFNDKLNVRIEIPSARNEIVNHRGTSPNSYNKK